MYEIYENETSIFLITELLEGGELLNVLKTQSQMNQNDLQVIMFKLLQAINHIHQNGYMHRDIKPENIMFRSKNANDVVLIDFGLMTKVEMKKYHFVKCGSPGFVAPEILKYDASVEEKLYDQQCDMFSLGVVFYIMTTGIHPFKGKDYGEILKKNMRCEVDFEVEQFGYFPGELVGLLRAMLEPVPRKRISCQEALRHAYFSQFSQQATPLDSFRNLSNYQSDFLDHLIEHKSEHDLFLDVILGMDQDINDVDSPNLGQKMKQLSI